MASDDVIAPEGPQLLASEKPVWTLFGLLLLVLIWAYWNMLREAYFAWQGGLYSHGYLIPVLSAVLLWLRRKPLEVVPDAHRYIGIGILIVAMLLRGFFCAYTVFDMWTFILAFVGIIMVVGGLSMLKWAGPVAFLLLFMFPIPWSMEQAILAPLQKIATILSAGCLQILGFMAVRDGNTIHLANTQIGIVEQCSGLRMTTILLALSVAMILMNERALWEDIVVLVFAVPIAIATNVARIVVTGMMMSFFPNNPGVDKFVHDAAGICMVPFAIMLLVVLQTIMSHLFVEEEEFQKSTDLMESPREIFWKDKQVIED
ncbi:MAG: exosortase/archaeosortase family protein [Planctomycetia bacterium]|nr:exosortase/archaeosortase family protein [Planctomycetia bacterium]